ncbi:MAG TPA: tRNA (N6-threonylcarbamoyladenosine(37)-N6)-methyltransferase TrmO [Deltaproteobacteria bacterium]|nr:tRNA (N6-threonylcarbamoyladenosine(37)-N6)-methyltransferase TrmO [Deltaproteobacteria bacterium]
MSDTPRSYTDAVEVPGEVLAQVIGWVRSPFTERHGTPRQPGLSSAREAGVVEATVQLDPKWVHPDALQDLASFDHVWLISWLHLNGRRRRPLVRPPRGGPRRGVLATRAPHRPNPIGLSAVRLVSVHHLELKVLGIDLLDRTPVLDIKPYIPDFDAIEGASRGWLG